MGGLTSMRNIAERWRKTGRRWASTPGEADRGGAKEAFFRLKGTFPEGFCRVHLYALEGRYRTGVNQLREETKQDLKVFSDFLKEGGGVLKSLLHILGNVV